MFTIYIVFGVHLHNTSEGRRCFSSFEPGCSFGWLRETALPSELKEGKKWLEGALK